MNNTIYMIRSYIVTVTADNLGKYVHSSEVQKV